MHRDDIGVIQRCAGARLPIESLQALGIVRDVSRQDLDRDVPIEPVVVSTIDLAHPADAEPGDDSVGAECAAVLKCHLFRREPSHINAASTIPDKQDRRRQGDTTPAPTSPRDGNGV